jgi:hypothetical protein
VKAGHGGYLKAFIEISMEGMPGGVHIVLENIHRHTKKG